MAEKFGKSAIEPEAGPADRGPGSHSGLEDLPHERRIPGTASAEEGYAPDGGTRDDEAIRGLEVDPAESEAARRSAGT